jgi:hypothetical protein
MEIMMKKIYTKEFWQNNPEILEDIIKTYPHTGARYLSNKYNIPIFTIKGIALKNKLQVIKNYKDRICNICFKEKCIDGRKLCKKCYNIEHVKWEQIKLEENPIEYRIYNIFYAIKKRKEKYKEKLDFDWKYLLELYHKQNGKCYYTNRDMIATNKFSAKKQSDSISVDRIDSTKGYSKDNIVLCTWWANDAKCRLCEKEFYERCKSIYEKLKHKYN